MTVSPAADELARLGLDQIADAAWSMLAAGAESGSHPFHTPCIATIGRYGPMQRTVVLRQVDADQRLVVCHTDRRSSKAGDVKASPTMSWHFYDRGAKLQIKLHGCARLHTDDAFADACWERSAERSRSCYRASLGPGQTVAEPPDAPGRIGSAAEALEARANFAALACRVDFMEWLFLSGAGHRRAMLDLSERGTRAVWVSP